MGVLAEAVDRRRPAQEITLNLVAAFLLQEAQFLVGLDAFGNDRQPEALAEAEPRMTEASGLAPVRSSTVLNV